MERQMPKIDLFLLGELWLGNARRWWALGLALVILGMATLGWFGFSRGESVYEAHVSITASVEHPALEAALPEILGSELVRRQVCGYLNVDWVPAVSVSVLPNADVITLRVRHPDAEWAWRILEATVECAPKVAEYALGEVKLLILADSGIPTTPVGGKDPVRWMLLGAAAGAALWAVTVLVLTLLRQTLRTEEELDIPCLGMLREEGLTQRLAMELQKLPAGRRVVLVAGALPGEGAAALVEKLAGELARRGNRVLIFDCDRYSGTAWDADGAQVRSVDALPARLPEDVRRDFDVVLLNAPPSALTADGAKLSDLADGGLLIVRRDHAARHQIREMIDLLTQGGMPLLGWVFNKT